MLHRLDPGMFPSTGRGFNVKSRFILDVGCQKHRGGHSRSNFLISAIVQYGRSSVRVAPMQEKIWGTLKSHGQAKVWFDSSEYIQEYI